MDWKERKTSRYRLALLRVTGWFCILLGVFSLLDSLTMLMSPIGARLAYFQPIPGDLLGPLRPLLVPAKLLLGAIMPFVLGFLLIQLARVHERLNRQEDDIEELRWRGPADGSGAVG